MTRTVLMYIVGSLIVGGLIYGIRRMRGGLHPRTIVTDVFQGILAGAALAFITLLIVAHASVTKVNGWTTLIGCGEPRSSLVKRAACGVIFPGPINTPQEAMYWETDEDGAGHTLSGRQDYVMHFPPNGLPPARAFWSLTMSDAKNRFVANPIHRYSLSDRSGLVSNADGSLDIYIQHAPRADHESNWLPAPSGNFILWLRAYLPDQSIINGKYIVPPVVKVK